MKKKLAPVTVVDINFGRPPSPPDGTIALPPPGQPMRVARELVKALYTLPGGIILRSHRGDFFRWDGSRYLEIDRRDVRKKAYEFLEPAVYWHPKDGWRPFAATQRKIADLLDALHAVAFVESRPDAPLWIDYRETPAAHQVVAMTNGLLHVPTRILHPHTTQFFNQHALAFAYDPKAPRPERWFTFLKQLWPEDVGEPDALQEAIGYILGGDTRLQKMFLFVGPKRGGKGTIGRVLTGLLGAHHVAAPTLSSLSTNFGLQPLIGKALALISDARLSTKAESHVVVERLLSISGEDSLTIDRKYKEPWTGKLPTRFIVMTNELPRLLDASGALASRFIILTLQQSFYNVENPRLTEELLSEAPGIFNWALDGLDRLVARGYLVNPSSGQEAARQLEDLSSPISAFLRDRCVVHRKLSTPIDEVWAAWKHWCEDNGQASSTKILLGRDLRTAIPTLRSERPRQEGDTTEDADTTKRPRVYVGLGLQPEK
jgi:putative DNA primase/helicase